MKNINRSTGNLIACIIEAILGILLLINPVGFTSGIIIALGVILTIQGVVSLLTYFRQEPETAAESNGLANGLIYTVVGLFCMFRSEWFIVTFPILTVLYGILTLVNGIRKVQWAVDMFRQKQKFWYITVIGAALTLLFAILILTNPFASTAILWTFIGITLLVEAVVDIFSFFLGRKN